MEKSKSNKTNASVEEAFDRIAERYERYVPWESRLAREIPFLEGRLRAAGAHRILDSACGPGRHAAALAKRGFQVTGLDASQEMLTRARQHARAEGVEVDFVEGRFEALPETFLGRFDGLLCLGNSLSAADDRETVERVIAEAASALRPGGTVITQTVDFSVVARGPATPAPVRFIRENDIDLLFAKSFLRVHDQVCIHWLSLEGRAGKWSSEVSCRPVLSVDPEFLIHLFRKHGFSVVETLGDYGGSPFQSGTSRDLIVVAKREAR